MSNVLFFDIALVVIVSGILAWLSLLLKQPIILAYILAGVLLGPSGLKLVTSIGFINEVSNIGITLLLFLAGLSLHPREMVKLLGSSMLLTLGSAVIFAVMAGMALHASGFGMIESAVAGSAMMFSSTILVVKLMPTTTLHQQHMGAVGISILIMQDLLAILFIALIKGSGTMSFEGSLYSILKGCLLVGMTFLGERYALRPVVAQVSRYSELLNLIVLAWCFCIALGAEATGLSHETGAFIAGMALANNPASKALAEELKFFRDFFLVLFFFTLGARLDFSIMQSIAMPSLLLSALIIVVKPFVFRKALMLTGETPKFSSELAMRLGQNSEFSFIIAVIAAESGMLSPHMSQLVQLVTIVTMGVSSYILVTRYPTPLGLGSGLKID